MITPFGIWLIKWTMCSLLIGMTAGWALTEWICRR